MPKGAVRRALLTFAALTRAIRLHRAAGATGGGSAGPEQAVREKIKNTFIIIIGVIVVKIITADAEPPAN